VISNKKIVTYVNIPLALIWLQISPICKIF